MTTPALNPSQQPKRPSWFAHHKILTSIGALFLVGASFGAHGSGGRGNTSLQTNADSVDPSTTPASMTTPALNPPQQPKRPSWFARHKIVTSIGALFLVGASFGAHGSGGHSITGPATTTSSVDSSTRPDSSSNDATNTGAAAQTSAPAAKPAMTAGQAHALKTAKDYLNMTSLSRAALIQQLSSSAGKGYSRADAAFAVDHLKVDWNEEAVMAARDYLKMTSFSRAGLIQQLSSKAGDGFTQAQAVYALNHAGR